MRALPDPPPRGRRRAPRHDDDRRGRRPRAESLRPAMRGVETAYYLVHSMGSATSFEEQDRRGAANFAAAAREAGVRRIVYLGGLGAGGDLSSHLASRQEVGRILADSGVQTIEFRASIVIGSGSLSFEMIRKLVERLPVMITPRWVRTMAQPIAIEDVLAYLVAALDVELEGSAVFEIGGADQVSYEELMREYARQLGLRRLIIPVPLLTARLSSLWLGLVTPVYARVGRKLIDSLPHETVVRSASAVQRLPDPAARLPGGDRPRPRERGPRVRGDPLVGRRLLRRPAAGALRRCPPRQAAGRLPLDPGAGLSGAGVRPIRRIGGDTGWYFGDRLWRLRGFIDLLAGGVGCAAVGVTPRSWHPVAIGVDFWRVEAYEPNRSAPPARRDEAPGAGLAPVRGRRGRLWQHDPPDGDLPSRPACSAPATGTASSRSTRGSSAAC